MHYTPATRIENPKTEPRMLQDVLTALGTGMTVKVGPVKPLKELFNGRCSTVSEVRPLASNQHGTVNPSLYLVQNEQECEKRVLLCIVYIPSTKHQDDWCRSTSILRPAQSWRLRGALGLRGPSLEAMR